MKRMGAILAIFCLSACLGGCRASGGNSQTVQEETSVSEMENTLEETGQEKPAAEINWDEAVSQAILKENSGKYQQGECQGEGHLILKQESREQEDGENEMTIYALTMYGEYEFQNGNLVKTGGSGAIPAVISFIYNDSGSWKWKDYHQPQEGSLYESSIREMFPEELQAVCISISEETKETLKNQEQAYAKAYLEELGRDSAVGDYGDFEYTLLTDAGVSAEVSNHILENKELSRYPYWIGTIERLEDGTRWEYRTELDKEDGIIKMIKTEKESGNVVESFEIPYELVRQQTILTSPPVLKLKDSLSSQYGYFEVQSGNYLWNYPADNGEMAGIVACGSAPLPAASELEKLTVPDYNGMEEVPYSISLPVAPDEILVTEYDAADIGKEEGELLGETKYKGTEPVRLRKDRVYNITLCWDKERLEENGFYGEAEYVIVTE